MRFTLTDRCREIESIIQSPNNDLVGYHHTISSDGQVFITKKIWIARILMLLIIISLLCYRLSQGGRLNDPFMIYSCIMPAITILTLFGAWCWYRNPARGAPYGNDLVSVIIPVYNQKNMIEIVIDAVYRSKYENIEVIAVNDGSTDGTKKILDGLKEKYPNLKVIHKERGGKRKACATGYYSSRGKYVVQIDSDSVMDENAIVELMKAFDANPEFGAFAGEIRSWNANKCHLTKLQDAWHIMACNINKAYESAFGSVTCCSGPLSAYRREAISTFMPYWADSNALSGGGIDRELTAYIIAPGSTKDNLLQSLWPRSSTRQKLLQSALEYDDSDDRMLTAHSLVKWKTGYVATAFTYDEVPSTWKQFFKQQTRWKKGFLRTNFYLSTYFWKGRHPLASIIYYLDVITGLTQPFIIATIVFYEPLIMHQFGSTLAFVGGIVFSAFAQGLDLKLRYPPSKSWMYMPLVSLLGAFVCTWLLFSALWNFRKNSWMTR